MIELASALTQMVRIAVAAGEGLGRGLSEAKQVTYKGEVDLLTEFDLRSEELIRRELASHFPGVSVLAEEGGGATAGAAARFIVDPLDGTTNFAHGHPVFCVCMALEVDGQLCCGVVHAPSLGWTFQARQGGGAYRNGARLSVSSCQHLDKAMLATGFPYDRRTNEDDNTAELRAFMKRCQAIRRLGSAALDLALVAEGIYDGYWEMGLKPWDIAAGVLLVTEAGGRVTNYEGEAVVLESGQIVASCGRPHDEMLQVLSTLRSADARKKTKIL